ncbi:two-component regulator propeller domain-containing protein [Bacteroidota bacterium]
MNDAGHNPDHAFKGRKNRKFPPWLSAFLLLVSLGILVYGFFFYDRGFDYDSLPEGWVIIRPPHDVHAMVVQGDSIWTGGKEGVFCIDRINHEYLDELVTDPPLEYVRVLHVDKQGKLWIGHANGLTCYDGENFCLYNEATGLPDNRVNAIISDTNGGVLIGTWKGVGRMCDGEFKMMEREEGLLDNMVNVLMNSSDGSTWFGSYTAPRGGITVMKKGQVQYFDKDNGLPHNNVTSIIEDLQGSVWVGTGLYKRGGAVRFSRIGDAWKIDSVLTCNDGLAGEKVRSVFPDREQRMWFGSEYDGLTVCDGKSMITLSGDQGLSHPEVKCILQDSEDNIWLGTHDGITFLSSAVADSLVRTYQK